MKKVIFTIDNHSDRMDLLKALQDNGYEARVIIQTKYIPSRYVVEVCVNDYEIKEVN